MHRFYQFIQKKEPDRPTGSFLISAESVKLQRAQILFAFFPIRCDGMGRETGILRDLTLSRRADRIVL